MPDEKEIPEFFTDMFEVVGGPYGIVINFMKSPPVPRTETKETVARIRTSWEHAKAMTFVMQRHVKKIEQDMGVSYPLPSKVLSDMGIAKEDWDTFWKPESGL